MAAVLLKSAEDAPLAVGGPYTGDTGLALPKVGVATAGALNEGVLATEEGAVDPKEGPLLPDEMPLLPKEGPTLLS